MLGRNNVGHCEAKKFQVAKLGSNWNNSANDSAFYLNLNNTSSNRNRNISRQLLNTHSPKGIISPWGFLYTVFP